MEKITIAIASYNNARYIERCINSVIAQDYKNLEVLIIDDGSNDDTLLICEKYKNDNRVRIISQNNGGLSSVRQRGLDEASGDYICFIDADDYLKVNYVSSMLNKLSGDHADICVCSTRFESEKGEYLKQKSLEMSCKDSIIPISLLQDSSIYKNKEIVNQIHLSDSWNKMYRLPFLKESGVRFVMAKGKNGSDSLFNRLLALHCPKYSTIENDAYIHVIYAKSAVHRKNKDLLTSYMLITEALNNESVKLGIQSRMKDYILNYYISSLRAAFQDIYNESENLKETIIRFKGLLERSISFTEAKRLDIMSLKYKDIESVSLNTFLFLYKNVQWSLPLYFNIRKRFA